MSVHEMFKQQPFMFGGADSPFANESIPDIDLRRKYAVFYRAIENREVEVLASFKLPKTNKDILPFWKTTIIPKEDYYDGVNRMIPELQDMIKLNLSMKPSQEDRAILRRKIASFQPHIAIYNPRTREVEHITYTEYNCLIDELGFDRSRTKEIKRAVRRAMRYTR